MKEQLREQKKKTSNRNELLFYCSQQGKLHFYLSRHFFITISDLLLCDNMCGYN